LCWEPCSYHSDWRLLGCISAVCRLRTLWEEGPEDGGFGGEGKPFKKKIENTTATTRVGSPPEGRDPGFTDPVVPRGISRAARDGGGESGRLKADACKQGSLADLSGRKRDPAAATKAAAADGKKRTHVCKFVSVWLSIRSAARLCKQASFLMQHNCNGQAWLGGFGWQVALLVGAVAVGGQVFLGGVKKGVRERLFLVEREKASGNWCFFNIQSSPVDSKGGA
jgi:hypothetical protein